MRSRRRQLLAAIAIGALWPLAACHPHVKGLSKEKTMKKYPLKPYAVGRYLIDLPEAATEVSWGQRFAGMSIEWTNNSEAKFEHLLAEKRHALIGRHMDRPILLEEKRAKDGNTHFYLFQQTSPETGLLEVNAYRYSHELKGFHFFSSQIDPERSKEGLPYAERVVQAVQPRLITSTMTDRGACFDHAFVSGGDPSNFEDVAVMVSFNDINLSFSTQVIDAVDTGPTLLERSTILDRFPEVILLRQSAREVARLNGEELAYKTKRGSGITSHSFEWDYIGKPNSIMAPRMKVLLDIERGVAAALLPDEELLGVWDAILGSIRLRTGAV
ncbi:T6SS immunity protein Tli4 family protein [Herbaspirillum sp. RTI4]|uniref:T6SS immunity protein Tli4 family protein n=1 Tax=Herbaspirillum sp. RTI4 TaxID=3048640 RepID=UPI002AB5C729|nr:T6SS immunity protein Tli4 family protein [Herbaspirillum sp. RTI4]MDY7576725.1 T6SS immunity protein Tli4 family protein [Herbaspirillum sp. RTI4]MEA9983548.1 T6SS immunity protein Tli4 family protein [Herbaspirillum sp. RTI4]